MSYVQRRRFLWAMFLAGLALIAIAVHATTLARLPFYQLVKDSSAIARLRCIAAQTRLEDGEIWTDSVFEVMQFDKGYLPSHIVVRTPGGVYQHLHSHVDGVPEFHPGEEVFLFLTGHPGIPFRIVGWKQGTFRIRRNAFSGLELPDTGPDAIRWHLRNQSSPGRPYLRRLCRAPRWSGDAGERRPRPNYAVPQLHDGSRLATGASLRRPHARHAIHHAHPSRPVAPCRS